MCEQVPNTSDVVRVDQRILQHMMNTGTDFLMEVTNKTKGDVEVSLVHIVRSTQNEICSIGWYSHSVRWFVASPRDCSGSF